MVGRESELSNNVFYVCGLVEYIGRATHNRRALVADALGRDWLEKLVRLADVYHCENIDAVAGDLIEQCHIERGTFDNVGQARYAVPSHWDIGKVYKRLALGILTSEAVPDPTPAQAADAIARAFHSPVAPKIDDYNGSFFYEAPANILTAHLHGVWE